ncbi:hypothetical protein [Algoriphagus chordae]|uniref:Uncharacterized protein n=1 Tax=Algoriphagus chordae TaxID=237019 RepID=A0A2W7R064_9BACT|nr:hypothetical protein [Algoriphagus chordae]PZX54198.1 hypothetical protein LV85_01538 [Algoriphagus chordae]
MYKRANFNHCTNSELRKELIRDFNLPSFKVIAILFFLENLKIIDKEQKYNNYIKEELNWDLARIQNVVGYNFNEGLRHIFIIDQLCCLSKDTLTALN